MSGMLYNIPVFAVLSENLGSRGAHRVAYQEFLHKRNQSTAVVSADRGLCGKETSGGCTFDRFFRTFGYVAAGFFVVRVALIALNPKKVCIVYSIMIW